MANAPKLKYVPDQSDQEKKLEMLKLKREAELYLSKIKEKLKDKKAINKAALIIEEMIKQIPPKKP